MQATIIIESFRNISQRQIEYYLKSKRKVIVIESFAGLHKKRGPTPGFPYPHPAYVQDLIKEGKIGFLSVDLLDEKTFYAYAADKAVEVVEAVYREYEKKNGHLISFVCRTLKDDSAENGFKKDLCQRLAIFYSENILLHRINKYFGSQPIIIYPESNVVDYCDMQALIKSSGQEVFSHSDIEFPLAVRFLDSIENIKKSIVVWSRLFIQTMACLFLGQGKEIIKNKKAFLYGMTVMSPRQLRSNQRGPAFLVDEKKIFAKDVICFPLLKVSAQQQKDLKRLPVCVCPLPAKGKFFSNGYQWLNLLWKVITSCPWPSRHEIHVASILYFQYFCWLALMQKISLKNFITHVDFDIGHIGRNIALNQSGVKTWYFSDSMNLGCVYWGREDGCQMRHPYWTYLNYDHFVTWTDLTKKFYTAHPTQLKQTHVVGCLWSQQVSFCADNAPERIEVNKQKALGKFVVVAFDTTYSLKGYATYAEGLIFTQDILKLLESDDEIHLVLKEKKQRDIHQKIDPFEAPKLMALYEQMKMHPRVSVFSNQADSASLIAVADMVISFPFTSSTFEAFSCGKPAIWHDPLGFYRDTIYGRQGGFVTHGFEQLWDCFVKIRKSNGRELFLPEVRFSQAMDPYNDGKAIDRFRDLLIQSKADLS